MSDAIAEVRKNASETIRVTWTTFNERDLLDVRVWYEAADGELKPSRKGLTLRPETWAELLPIIHGQVAADDHDA